MHLHRHARSADQNASTKGAAGEIPIEPLEARRLLSAGDLDPTFGVGGRLTDSSFSQGAGVVVQSSGKYVVAGTVASNFALARYNADGTLDSSFGYLGKVNTDFGGTEAALAIAVLPDDRIVVVGGNIVARYTAGGQLDPTFGGGKGFVSVPFDAHSVAVQPDDGKIVLGGKGRSPVGVEGVFAFMRLNSDGSTDTAFGEFGNGIEVLPEGDPSVISDVLVQADHQIVGVGDVVIGREAMDAPLVLRLSAQGVPDHTSFLNPFNSRDVVYDAVAQAADGSIIVAGEADQSAAVVRYLPNGQLSFATKLPFGSDVHEYFDVAVDGNNEIVAGGGSDTSGGGLTAGDFYLARYDMSGNPDVNFGTGGAVRTDFGKAETIRGLAVAPGQKIIAAGGPDFRLNMARYDDRAGGTTNPGGPPNGPYGLKVVNVSSDGARVQLSFIDNANNETAFVLERGLTAAGPFAAVKTLPPSPGSGGIVSVTDDTTKTGTTYYYRAYAINGPYVSSIAGPVAVTTPGEAVTNPGGPPNGPYGLTATQGAGPSVNLFFIDNASNETGFVIERGASAAGPFAPLASLPPSSGSGGVVSYTDATASGGQTWYYRAYAVNGPFVSSIAGPVGITVGSGGSGVGTTTNPGGPPNGPYGLTAYPLGPSQVQLKFFDNATNETGFVVERSTTSAAGPFAPVATLPPSSGANLVSFSDLTTQPATTYYYRVYAVNGPYQSSIAGPVAITTPSATPFASGVVSVDTSFNGTGEVVEADSPAAVKAVSFFDGQIFTLSIGAGGVGIVEHFAHDGGRDNTFGTGGKLQTPAGFVAAPAFARTEPGRYLIAGTMPHPGDASRHDVVVQALNSQGPDFSFGPGGFGGNGRAVIDLGADAQVGGMVVGPDGSIYVGGTVGGTGYFAARLTANGILDTSYGQGGISKIASVFDPQSGGIALPGPIALDPSDGSIVTIAEGIPLSAGGPTLITYLLGERLLPGGGGAELFRTSDRALTYDIRDVLIQPDRKIIYAGSVLGMGGMQGIINRVNADGSNGTGFHPPSGTLGPGGSHVFAGGDASLNSVLLLAGGKLLVGGVQKTNPTGTLPEKGDFLLMRLNPDGTIDASAVPGGDHILRTDFGGANEVINQLVLEPDGTVIGAGASNGVLALVRYKAS